MRREDERKDEVGFTKYEVVKSKYEVRITIYEVIVDF